MSDGTVRPVDFATTEQPALRQRPAASEISVSILYPGNRADKMLRPLSTTELDVAVEPADPYDADIVVVDNPDRQLGYEVLRKPFHDAALVYRMRGDVFHELQLWDMHPVKKWVAERQVLPRVDGVIAVSEWMAEKMQRRAGVSPVGVAGLAKRIEEWPTVEHSCADIRALTLTNANYAKKIRPIVEWAPVVDEFLADNGGEWLVAGQGLREDILIDGLAPYDNVHFVGYVDAKSKLAESNMVLHPSNLDALPNAVLEGMASRLPVITNDFRAFTAYDGPIVVAADGAELTSQLKRFVDPAERARVGDRGCAFVHERHSPEVIGQQYVEYFQRVVG